MSFSIVTYKRGSDMLAPPELKQIHPLGKSPVITLKPTPTSEPVVIAESALICEYLCEYFAQGLVPKRYKEGQEGKCGGETEQWLRYRFFMHYAEGSLMSLLLIQLIMDSAFPPFSLYQRHHTKHRMPGIKESAVPFFIKPITRGVATKVEDLFLNKNFVTHWSFLESQLVTSPDGGEYLCGKELTAADIMMSYPLTSRKEKIDRAQYPKLVAYIDKLEGSEAYEAAAKKIEEVTGEPLNMKFK